MRYLTIFTSCALVFLSFTGCGGDSESDEGPVVNANNDAGNNDAGNNDSGNPDNNDAGNNNDTDPLPTIQCEGISLTASGALGFDLPTVQISGRVTVNGQALPDASSSRGHVVFLAPDGQAREAVAIGQSGEATYSATLAPGTYDVLWQGNQALCGVQDAIPCNSGVILEAVNLGASGALDVDIPTVHIQGVATVNGAEMPSTSRNRGRLGFKSQNTASLAYTEDLDSSGAATYAITLVAGTYDIQWANDSALCNADSQPGVPCISGPLKQNVNLNASGSLNVDVPTVSVQGALSVNGATPPTADRARGQLRFALNGGGQANTEDVGDSGSAVYAIDMLAGQYDIWWQPNESLCSGNKQPGVPCVAGPILTQVSLTSSGSLDLDMSTVDVQGTVSVNGQPMPNPSQEGGALGFQLRDGGLAQTLTFDDDATYAITLLAGTYDVLWLANQARCASDSLRALPCVNGVVSDDVSLTASGSLNIDVPVVQIQGQVSVNGAPMPDASRDRGQLRFRGALNNTGVSAGLGTDGAGVYGISLMPQTYAIDWVASTTLCNSNSRPGVPCIDGPVRQDIGLTNSGNLDLDLAMIEVQGLVSVNGATAPEFSSATNRGHLRFQHTDGSTLTTHALEATGDLIYQASLFPGSYVIVYDGNDQQCAPGTSSPLPCGHLVIEGCSEFPSR